MRRFLLSPVLAAGALLAASSLSLAQSAPPAAPPTDPSAPSTAAPAASPPAPAAPAAPKPPAAPPAPVAAGPSPYSAPVQKGDSAYLARDFESAISSYREEIQKNPNGPLGHFRLGQAQLAKGDAAEAELSWQAALRFVGKDQKLKSKILFVLADLREREKAWADATARWKDYQEDARTQVDAKGVHSATAAERLKRIEEWQKISEDSAQVKARIEKRLKEVDESLRKSSK